MEKISGLRVLTIVGGLAALGLLAGCFETSDEFTLNPDGSGKVVHESKIQNVDMSGGNKSSEAQLKKAVAEFLNQAKGVDAWSDVSFESLDDGRIHFKGTAYFRQLSDLDLPNQTVLEFNWAATDDHTGVLSLREKKTNAGADKKTEKTTPATPAAIKEARAKYQQGKPMLALILGTMKHDVTFHLPGQPGKTTGFQTDSSGALELEFDGAKLLTTMDQLMANDAWMARNSGKLGADSSPALDDEMSLMLFGAKGPVKATVSGLDGATFDYDTEVATAKDSTPAWQAQLGIRAGSSAPAAQGGELKSIKVVGVRLVGEIDSQLELQALGVQPGYTLALLAELPGSVHAMGSECGLDSAIADDGTDLLPESEFSRRFSFPKLSADKTAVLLDAEMKAPGPGVTALKELSGHVQYTVAGTATETDLGFPKLVTGAKGKEHSAEIKSVEVHGKESFQIELQLQLDPDTLKALYLVNGSEKTELTRNGYSGSNDDYTYTYSAEIALPAKAHLVAEVYGQIQTFDATFKLENIPLLGDVLGAK